MESEPAFQPEWRIIVSVSRQMSAAFLCLVFAMGGRAVAEEPADMAACVAAIREQGMSEMAATHIGGIAFIRLGQGSLTFVTMDDSGRYYPSFHSNSCPMPGADPDTLAARQQRAKAACDAERTRLQPLADTDGSGFVSTIEAIQFRVAFEFASLMDQLQLAGDYSMERVLIATGLDAALLESRMRAYAEVRRKAEAAGVIDLPVIGVPQ